MRNAISSTTHDNARTELFEKYMQRRYPPYPQLAVPIGESLRRKSKKSSSAKRVVAKVIATKTFNSRSEKREDDHDVATARAGPAPEHREGVNSLQQCEGRTIYNATTTSLGPFGEILDATLPNGEVDSTLMEIGTILKEERLRVAEWQALVYGQGTERWAYHGSTSPFVDRPFETSRPTPSTSTADHIRDPETMELPLEAMSEAQLEQTFHQYFKVDEHMSLTTSKTRDQRLAKYALHVKREYERAA
ncbi:hypothetical protein PILCRDRAFT_13643 [Piloderma croceum F 1598]|uniref:Uncharacterized protein n=1 Tax=Piloderma croceum (strain F 1598) TaxID=765440 RepID=A0A0C3F5T6_PILCF|nr:hypothetical protein PILCRDRAFT_13643 [Piloderma croceum F 1598]